MSILNGVRTRPLADVRLDGLPDIRISAPNCDVALLEMFARWKFGIRDLDRAYFNHGFSYVPAIANQRAIIGEGRLNLSLQNSDHFSRRYRDKLRRFYGLEWASRSYDDFDTLLTDVHAALCAQELVMSSFDLGFSKTNRAYGVAHLPHAICPVGLSMADGVLFAIDNLGTELAVPLADYAACFGYIRSKGDDFTLSRSFRTSDDVVWPGPIEIREDLDECLTHLFTDDPHQGLNALRSGVAEIQAAIAELQRPFFVPGLWSFARDRHNLRSHAIAWREMELADDATLRDLEHRLDYLATNWNLAEMLSQDALARGDSELMQDVRRLLSKIVGVEARTAALLQQVGAQLPDG